MRAPRKSLQEAILRQGQERACGLFRKSRPRGAAARGVFVLLNLMLLGAGTAHAQVAQGIAPFVTPSGGLQIEGTLLANSPTLNIGDWVQNPGRGVLTNPGGVPLDPTTTFHKIDLTENDDLDTFDQSDKVNDNPNTYNWGAGSVPPKDDIQNGLIHVGAD